MSSTTSGLTRATEPAPEEGDRLERYRSVVEAVAAREPELAALDDGSLRRVSESMKARARSGAGLDELAPEALALVREAARRVLGLRPYDVQIAGGLALHAGSVVEMKTGEGKTLAAVGPVYLNALTGEGAHVLTFNDYLARRDAGWMGPVYEFLGLSVGFVQEGMSISDRQAAYGSDVTHLTAKEAGFDFLRDGLCLEPAEQVHRPLHFALVDEADSILIDEARIPLVIAGDVQTDDPGLGRLAEVARRLAPETDFDTDEYGHNVFLTTGGSERAEELLGCGSLFAAANSNLMAALRNALHAEHMLSRDVDYIVRRGAVELVDEFTGRVAERRQWPDGLHAAVEAKEGLRLGADGMLLGSITLQHFLHLYPRLCGMTATALSAADELGELYGLEVEMIPPNRPCVRVDHEDLIYTHQRARDSAVLEEIVRVHRSGRPILVGTVSVAASERLAAGLAEQGVQCRVLNAKNDEQEAAIVAEAGAFGAVTISTNMAGRGTDIRLGGRDERQREEVVGLGGLYVVGTNLHESRRIDRQLAGRAGRQGDPGSSRFYLSLEDDLPRRYGIERLIPRKLFPERAARPIDSPTVRRELERAQRIVEGESFDVRKRLYSYSEILDNQRAWLRDLRQEVLEERHDSTLLVQRCGARRRALVEQHGEKRILEVEKRLTLLVIDRCWGEYLTEMQTIRDEMHLVTLDGRQPLAEFYRTAIRAFEELRERLDELLVESFDALEIGDDGVDWRASGLERPTATWTYLVSDNVFGNELMGTLANRASIGLWASLLLWWLLIPWGLYLHWKRRKKQASLDD